MTEATSTDVKNRQWPPYGVGSTRLLVLGWCLWLLGAWGMVLWNDSPVPATRWMVFSALIGLTAIWPVWRLSMSPGSDVRGVHSGDGRWDVIGGVLLDWACLILVFQAVIWPLRLTAGWSLMQTWWLDAAIAVWSGLTGLVIAWGRGNGASRGGRAMLAMGVCLALLLAEPALMLVTGGRWTMRVSPIETVWSLCAPPVQYRSEPWTAHVVAAAIAAAVGWLALGLWAGAARLRGPRPDAASH